MRFITMNDICIKKTIKIIVLSKRSLDQIIKILINIKIKPKSVKELKQFIYS